MLDCLFLVTDLFRAALRSRREPVAENLLLHQQLAVCWPIPAANALGFACTTSGFGVRGRVVGPVGRAHHTNHCRGGVNR